MSDNYVARILNATQFRSPLFLADFLYVLNKWLNENYRRLFPNLYFVGHKSLNTMDYLKN